jgi:hypothetical protein
MISRKILILIIIFTWISVLLTLFGIVNMNYSEIISYVFLLLGISLFYPSYNKNDKTGIFFGSAIFLGGIVFFITNNFEIIDDYELLVPSLVIIISVSLLMIYLCDTKDKKFIWLASVMGVVGLFTIFYRGTPSLKSFFVSFISLLGKAWIIVIIMVITIILLIIEKKNKQVDDSSKSG